MKDYDRKMGQMKKEIRQFEMLSQTFIKDTQTAMAEAKGKMQE